MRQGWSQTLRSGQLSMTVGKAGSFTSQAAAHQLACAGHVAGTGKSRIPGLSAQQGHPQHRQCMP